MHGCSSHWRLVKAGWTMIETKSYDCHRNKPRGYSVSIRKMIPVTPYRNAPHFLCCRKFAVDEDHRAMIVRRHPDAYWRRWRYYRCCCSSWWSHCDAREWPMSLRRDRHMVDRLAIEKHDPTDRPDCHSDFYGHEYLDPCHCETTKMDTGENTRAAHC